MEGMAKVGTFLLLIFRKFFPPKTKHLPVLDTEARWKPLWNRNLCHRVRFLPAQRPGGNLSRHGGSSQHDAGMSDIALAWLLMLLQVVAPMGHKNTL